MTINKKYTISKKIMRIWLVVISTSIITALIIMAVALLIGCHWMSYNNEKADPQEIPSNKNTELFDQIDLNRKDSLLIAAIKHHQAKINELEIMQKKHVDLKDEIRQETNNIINKFNGWISLWLVILTLICGLAPLILALKQNTNSRELFTAQKEELEKIKAELGKIQKQTYEEMEKVRTERINFHAEREILAKDSKELKEKLTDDTNNVVTSYKNKINKLTTKVDFYLSLTYITIITKTVDFQSSRLRPAISDYLLFNLINRAIKFYETNFSEDDIILKKLTLYRIWINTLCDGLNTLINFQNSRARERKIFNILDELRSMRDTAFSVEEDKKQLITKGKRLYEELTDIFATKWPHADID